MTCVIKRRLVLISLNLDSVVAVIVSLVKRFDVEYGGRCQQIRIVCSWKSCSWCLWKFVLELCSFDFGEDNYLTTHVVLYYLPANRQVWLFAVEPADSEGSHVSGKAIQNYYECETMLKYHAISRFSGQCVCWKYLFHLNFYTPELLYT